MSLWSPTLAYLLISALRCLDASLLQRVIIVEEEEQQMPEDATLVEMGLQPEVYTELTGAVHNHGT